MEEIKYPLVPMKPKKGDKIFAYVKIIKVGRDMMYVLTEPPISKDGRKKLEELKTYIQEKVDIDFSQLRKNEALEYIEKVFDQALNYFRIKAGSSERDVYKYYIFRDFVGMERLEAILNDPNIEDVSCDGIGIPIYVYHRNSKIGSLKTNVTFDDKEELDAFVTRLAERCGRTISVSKPLLDASLPNGSRVQATLGTDIARHGSNFTIRMFTKNPMTPVQLIDLGTADVRLMAYLWLLIENGSSILVSGGTATGKTSLLNAISLFIRPELKIVSIEDTAELRLTHENWVPEVARVVISEKSGQVDMYELLRESLRQRPDYIVVGEVRGKEAFVLFQQMAVGHPGLSTIHAENFNKLVGRLTTEPINLQPSLIENLDAILFAKKIRWRGKYIRRIGSVVEVSGYSREEEFPYTTNVFKWNPNTDVFESLEDSAILKKIADKTAMSASEIQDDIRKKARILQWMVEHKITNYIQFSDVMKMYYNSPERLMQKIGVFV